MPKWIKNNNKMLIILAITVVAIVIAHFILRQIHSDYKENNVCTFFDKPLCQRIPFCEPVYMETDPCRTSGQEICPTSKYPQLFKECTLKRERKTPQMSQSTPESPIINTSANDCAVVWSNCGCAYKAIKKADLQKPVVDCQRECTNEKSAEQPTALSTYGQCVLIHPNKNRFNCESYNKNNCPVNAGCQLELGNTDVYPTTEVCKGIIERDFVVVTLSIPLEAEVNLSSKDVQKQRELIKSTQEKLISELPGIYEVYKQYETTPNLGLKVNEEALEFLESSPLVKTVQEDKPVVPLN